MNRRHKRRPRRSQPLPIADITSIQVQSLYRGNPEVHPRLWTRWTHIAGEQLAQRTFPLKLQKGLLFVGVSSSTWMQQISFLRDELLQRIAQEVGPGVVTEIRLMLDSVPRRPAASPPPQERATPSAPDDIDEASIPEDIQQMVAHIDNAELAQALARAITAFSRRR
ncbi:MAG: DUF721 domain-containing protein [Proteobacteria bacterium]|nr:DUF721 domain-containing protein [Pseudomonadota bacterium]